jgi:ABC-2 type transport system permease protein
VTWNHVFARDLLSVYRSRTGTAVAAILALFTVVVVGLTALAADLPAVAAVFTLVTVGAVVAMVFLGSPRTVAAFVGVFVVLAVGLTAALATPEQPPDNRTGVLMISGALSLVVPLVGLLGSYAAIVGERTTGSVRFLLGLPNSREDAFVGKYLSRSAVVLVPLVAGVLLAGVVVATAFENGSFLAIVGIGLVSIPYALLFVGLGLSASAVADTDNRAVAMALGAFVVLRAGWPALQWLGLRSIPPEQRFPRPEWYFWLGRVNPINAYVRATQAFVEEFNHPLLTRPRGFSSPVITLEFALLVLLVWALATPLVGYWYFRRRDLL